MDIGDPQIGPVDISSAEYVGQKDTVSISPAINFVLNNDTNSLILEENAVVKGKDVTIKSEFSSVNARFETARKNLLD